MADLGQGRLPLLVVSLVMDGGGQGDARWPEEAEITDGRAVPAAASKYRAPTAIGLLLLMLLWSCPGCLVLPGGGGDRAGV